MIADVRIRVALAITQAAQKNKVFIGRACLVRPDRSEVQRQQVSDLRHWMLANGTASDVKTGGDTGSS